MDADLAWLAMMGLKGLDLVTTPGLASGRFTALNSLKQTSTRQGPHQGTLQNSPKAN